MQLITPTGATFTRPFAVGALCTSLRRTAVQATRCRVANRRGEALKTTEDRMTRPAVWVPLIGPVMLCASLSLGTAEVPLALTPEPQALVLARGTWPVRGRTVEMRVPVGGDHEACALVLAEALRLAGAVPRVVRVSQGAQQGFRLGPASAAAAPPPPDHTPEAYTLQITPTGASAAARSAAGLLYAAQTFRQLARIGAADGALPCLTVTDYPELPVRGIYIEGGQERGGRIVAKEYLLQQVRRLSESKLNTLVIECYNLFPFPSFPACADSWTLSPDDCRELQAEARRYHITVVPSLQTLAQAWELVWNNEAGAPYRETTAPGMICPSNPDVYPFIKGLYRDLLTLFADSPYLGIGCSEIDMQWQGRFCPRCQARVDAGETPRDLLLGHAEKCIAAVSELAAELGRPVRPLLWADEFYMYGPGRDWVGIERIPRHAVMGFWKYWGPYDGLGGLLERGYDVLGVSAMYNHCFYLADLSPGAPRKLWAPMEETGVRNITEMVQAARGLSDVTDQRLGGSFLGVATASFSKHRLRAFDTIWYGFALNGHCTWSKPLRPLSSYQPAFTRAFVWHYYGCRSAAAAARLTEAFERLDGCKSQLELANQTLRDVVGVYDTQEPGYAGNTLLDALRRCGEMVRTDGEPAVELGRLRYGALAVMRQAKRAQEAILACQEQVERVADLGDLWLAAEKIAAHAERQVLMVDTQTALRLAEAGKPVRGGELVSRWRAHRLRMERILRRTRPLYRSGDPCGLASLLGDISAIEAHLEELAGTDETTGAPGEVLLAETFQALDTSRWIVRGEPAVAAGELVTAAPGGWANYCGVTTREALALDDRRPLVVEFTVTPTHRGLSTPLFGSGTPSGDLDYRFCFCGLTDRFAVYTQAAQLPPDGRVAGDPGWHLRGQSAPFAEGTTYRVRAEITRRSFRVVVGEAAATRWRPPFWDSGRLPMDALTSTRLLFAAVEPSGMTSQCRWGPIRISRKP